MSQHQLLANIASMYYEEGLTQNAIATQLNLSRVKVYRLLKQAKAEGVVQITINWPDQRDSRLESALKERFKLQEALVLQLATAYQAQPLHQLGQLGARYLEQALKDGMTLTVCLGRSTYEVINAIRPGFQARVHVAQAMGSMPFAMQQLDSATLARQLAQKLGGEVLYLSSPLMADNAEAAEVLRAQSHIRQTIETAQKADVALLGIGNLNPATSGFVKAGFLSEKELADLAKQGAVGDMAGQFFTAEGNLHSCDYNRRVIGLSFEALRHIPLTIAVAMGREKAPAILGALKSGIINTLIVDNQTAEEVLEIGR